MDAMAVSDEVPRVGNIASFASERLKALATSIASASTVTQKLRSAHWPVFQMIAALADDRKSRAALIVSRVQHTVAIDEADASLESGLSAAVTDANALMLAALPPIIQPLIPPAGSDAPVVVAPVAPPSPPGTSVVRQRTLRRAAAAETSASLDELLKLLKEKPQARVNLTWEVVED